MLFGVIVLPNLVCASLLYSFHLLHSKKVCSAVSTAPQYMHVSALFLLNLFTYERKEPCAVVSACVRKWSNLRWLQVTQVFTSPISRFVHCAFSIPFCHLFCHSFSEFCLARAAVIVCSSGLSEPVYVLFLTIRSMGTVPVITCRATSDTVLYADATLSKVFL